MEGLNSHIPTGFLVSKKKTEVFISADRHAPQKRETGRHQSWKHRVWCPLFPKQLSEVQEVAPTFGGWFPHHLVGYRRETSAQLLLLPWSHFQYSKLSKVSKLSWEYCKIMKYVFDQAPMIASNACTSLTTKRQYEALYSHVFSYEDISY